MIGLDFVDRVAELSALAEEAERASCGDPRIVQLSGPAGIGKSALAGAFLAGRPELTRVHVAGAEDETGMHLGVADALLRLLAARAGHGEDHTGAAIDNPLARGGDLIEYLALAQRRGTVAVIVDQLDWVDPASVAALAFAFRRLNGERILIILIGREEMPPDTCRRPASRRGEADRLGVAAAHGLHRGRALPARAYRW